MTSHHRILTLFTLALLPSTRVAAQRPQPPGSELNDYFRLLEITGRLSGAPLVFRPLATRHVGASLRADSSHPWEARDRAHQIAMGASGAQIVVLDPVIHAVYQSAYPRSVNDGALWAGRGPSAEISGGAMATWGPVTATFLPTLYGAANTDFETASVLATDRSAFAYPWHAGIDWPQRFGTKAVAQFDWGQSGIRLDLAGFTAGLGTENMWWGPAQRYPILMSNAAPGLPHLDLGTGRPVRTSIGRIETRVVWGTLAESRYFDTVTTNNRRFFAGLTAAIEPRWVPGLTLGLGRVLYMPWDSVDAIDASVLVQTTSRPMFQTGEVVAADDDGGQMLSLYARWILPQSGFETYLEWSRNEQSLDLSDFILEPDHARAFVVGFAKAFPSGVSIWRLRGEATNLERSGTFQVRPSPAYYVHPITLQGYTHRGQLIGAAIGPGASSQFLGVDRYSPAGRTGIGIERVRYDNDAYYDRFGPTSTRRGHDVELTLGLTALRFVGEFDLGGGLTVSHELNRYYRVTNNVTNLRAEFTARWRVP